MQSATLHGIKTWHLNDKKVAILRSHVCRKVDGQKNTSKSMTMLGLTVLMKMAAKANALRWFGHVFRAEDNRVRMAMNFEVKRKKTQKEHMKGKS